MKPKNENENDDKITSSTLSRSFDRRLVHRDKSALRGKSFRRSEKSWEEENYEKTLWLMAEKLW